MLVVKIDKEFIVNDAPERGLERRGMSFLTNLSFRGGWVGDSVWAHQRWRPINVSNACTYSRTVWRSGSQCFTNPTKRGTSLILLAAAKQAPTRDN